MNKNSGVSASTTMSSLGKACLELSKSIKGFRFNRTSSPPQDGKDATVSTSGVATGRQATAEDGSLTMDDVTSGSSESAAGAGGGGGGGSSVASTISRVIRSATNRVRAFPTSPSLSPHHQCQQQPQQQQQTQIPACNAVNGHSSTLVPLSTPPPPSPCRTARTRYIQPVANTDIWRDEQFLLQFFRYFSAMELCVLAQVLTLSL